MKGETTFSLYSGIVLKIQIIQSSPLSNLFPENCNMGNMRKLAAVSSERQEYPRNGHSQNISAP